MNLPLIVFVLSFVAVFLLGIPLAIAVHVIERILFPPSKNPT